MALYYALYNQSAGSGDGLTPSTGWNINDVALAANPKGLAAADILLLVFDPTDRENTAFTATTNLASWTSNYTYAGGMQGCDLSGNPTDQIPIIDFSGVGSGAAYTINTAAHKIFGIEIRNAPSHGIAMGTSGSHAMIKRCIIKDAAGAGIYGSTYATNVVCCENQIISPGSHGIYARGMVFVCGNYIEDPGSYGINAQYCSLSHNVIRMASGATVPAIYASGNTSNYSIAFNTIYFSGAPASAIYAIYAAASTHEIYGNIVQGASYAGCYAIYANASTPLVAANVAYDCANDIGGSPPWSQASDTTNPEFTNPANGDFSVGADLTGILWEPINGQFTIPGAVQPASCISGTSYPLPLSSYCKGVTGDEMKTIYPGKENAIGIKVYEDGARRTDLTALTRCRVIFGGVEVDSATTAAAFTLAYDDADGNDVILLDFGALSSTLPEGDWSATIIIYEPTRTNGFVCAEGYPIRIKTPQSGTLLTS